MKSILLRSLAVSALACTLASCGGGSSDADYEIAGTITDGGTTADAGVDYTGLQLKNGSDVITIEPGTKKFAFPTKLGYGDIYEVKVHKQPLHQQCTILSPALDGVAGRDSAGRLTVIDVVVRCAIETHSVVVATPKAPAGLTLTNGSLGGRYTLTGTETTVPFTVPYGESYGITILTQPTTGGPCRIENGVGVMGDVNKTDAKLVCP